MGGLAACELGEEAWVLVGFVACPGVVGAQGVEEAVFCFWGGGGNQYAECLRLGKRRTIRGGEGRTQHTLSHLGGRSITKQQSNKSKQSPLVDRQVKSQKRAENVRQLRERDVKDLPLFPSARRSSWAGGRKGRLCTVCWWCNTSRIG